MMAERLQGYRMDVNNPNTKGFVPGVVRELLDHIAQLEAQRGGAVVVGVDREEVTALRSFYEIVRCHMMAEGGIPMSDALGLAMDTLDEIRDRAQQAKGE